MPVSGQQVTMALYSRRFWNTVMQLDQKVTAAYVDCEGAIRRFRVSRRLIVDGSRAEFQLDVCESLADLRKAVRDLRQFQDRNTN